MTPEERNALLTAISTATRGLESAMLTEPLNDLALKEAKFYALAMVRHLEHALSPVKEHRHD